MPPLIACFLAALALIATPAAAQTWDGPDETRRPFLLGHAVENFDIAISEVCFPYLLRDAPVDTWMRRSGFAWFPPGGPFVGLRTYLIGGSAGAQVGVGVRNGARECTVKAESADPHLYREALDLRIAQLPFTLAPSSIPLPSDENVERQWLCSIPEGYGIIISAETARRRGRILVTFMASNCHASTEPRSPVEAPGPG